VTTVAEWTGRGGDWDAFVAEASGATVMHLHGWKDVMERSYGHPTTLLAAAEGGALRAVLPLTLVRSPLLGASLVSMPFMDYGGVCGDTAAERPLVDAATRLAREDAAELVLRYLRRPDLDMPCSLEKVTMHLELGTSEDALWKRLPSERRNRIRKGQKSGLVASVHDGSVLPEFYEVFATNMRDLGSPVHSRRFFREVMAALGPAARILLVRHEGRPVGAGLMLLFRGTISIPWVSSLRAFFKKSPNAVLYWEAMRYGISEGHRVLDLGRSSWNSGTFEAKRQWGASPVQLYWHHTRGSDEANVGAERSSAWRRLMGLPAGAKLQSGLSTWPVRVWQHLPIVVANAVGPWLRRGIPN
jgi:FemAB-related protein (PEP-CTERM system-associated)